MLAGGWVIAVAGVAVALRKLDERSIPRTAILSAAFFVVSLVAVPIGPSSVHLLLAGLMGLMIGVLTFPAVMVSLLLQAVLFGFGGLTTIGINTVNIALPGVVLGVLLAPPLARSAVAGAGLIAAACAAVSAAATGGGVAFALAFSSSEFVPSARIVLATYVPLMIGEAVITGFAISFVKRVRPEMLAGQRLARIPSA